MLVFHTNTPIQIDSLFWLNGAFEYAHNNRNRLASELQMTSSFFKGGGEEWDETQTHWNLECNLNHFTRVGSGKSCNDCM